jgi:hypothetical protein
MEKYTHIIANEEFPISGNQVWMRNVLVRRPINARNGKKEIENLRYWLATRNLNGDEWKIMAR